MGTSFDRSCGPATWWQVECTLARRSRAPSVDGNPLIVTDAQKADDASLTLLMGRLKKGRFVIDECSHRQVALSEGEVAPVGIPDGGMEVALPVRVGAARG
jgi:hypothetical protein